MTEGTPISRADAAAFAAEEMYERGWFCSEAVLVAVAEAAGLDLPEDAVRMASGFCEGGGGMRQWCGALAGAVMAIGALAGRRGPDDPWEPSYDAAAEVYRRFEDLEDTWTCAVIAERHGGMRHPARWGHCAELCGACAGWVIEIAEREGWLSHVKSSEG